jgi:hypothetical protein
MDFARVLRPSGALVINSCGHRQMQLGWWYAALIPDAVEAIGRRHVPLDSLEAMLAEAGFEVRGRFVPSDALMQGEHYFDPRGPLDANWRAGDSVWAMVSEEQLDRVLAQVREMDASGQLEAFVAEHDAERPRVGQFTFLFATRL